MTSIIGSSDHLAIARGELSFPDKKTVLNHLNVQLVIDTDAKKKVVDFFATYMANKTFDDYKGQTNLIGKPWTLVSDNIVNATLDNEISKEISKNYFQLDKDFIAKLDNALRSCGESRIIRRRNA